MQKNNDCLNLALRTAAFLRTVMDSGLMNSVLQVSQSGERSLTRDSFTFAERWRIALGAPVDSR